jgi:hypothetical protein
MKKGAEKANAAKQEKEVPRVIAVALREAETARSSRELGPLKNWGKGTGGPYPWRKSPK